MKSHIYIPEIIFLENGKFKEVTFQDIFTSQDKENHYEFSFQTMRFYSEEMRYKGIRYLALIYSGDNVEVYISKSSDMPLNPTLKCKVSDRISLLKNKISLELLLRLANMQLSAD